MNLRVICSLMLLSWASPAVFAAGTPAAADANQNISTNVSADVSTDVSADDSAALPTPKILHLVNPQAPAKVVKLLKRGKQVTGSVEMLIGLDDDGKPQNIRVVESTPEKMFDHAATNTLKLWRFAPLDPQKPEKRKDLSLTLNFNYGQ